MFTHFLTDAASRFSHINPAAWQREFVDDTRHAIHKLVDMFNCAWPLSVLLQKQKMGQETVVLPLRILSSSSSSSPSFIFLEGPYGHYTRKQYFLFFFLIKHFCAQFYAVKVISQIKQKGKWFQRQQFYLCQLHTFPFWLCWAYTWSVVISFERWQSCSKVIYVERKI